MSPARGPLVGIIGVTLGGNMGGQAMLEAARQQIARLFPGARFRLFSIYPEADAASPLKGDMEIASVKPLRLVSFDLGLAIAGLLLGRVAGAKAVRRLSFGHLRRVTECDFVIDLSGIAFVEGRGLPLLAYNLACCVPSFAVGTPHLKLAQSLGPFRSWYLRWLSRWALSRCALVIPRGERSAEHLRDLGFAAAAAPDTSFALELSDRDRAAAKALIPAAAQGRPLAIISPSRVTRQACERAGIDYPAILASTARALAEGGYFVLILPHSLKSDAGKNNDLAEAQALVDRIGPLRHVALVEPPEDAKILRATFAEAELALTSRFHATVAALVGGVPPVTISWSYKYAELLGYFDCEDLVIPAGELSAERIAALIARLRSDGGACRQKLRSRLPGVISQSHRNFTDAAEALARQAATDSSPDALARSRGAALR